MCGRSPASRASRRVHTHRGSTVRVRRGMGREGPRDSSGTGPARETLRRDPGVFRAIGAFRSPSGSSVLRIAYDAFSTELSHAGQRGGGELAVGDRGQHRRRRGDKLRDRHQGRRVAITATTTDGVRGDTPRTGGNRVTRDTDLGARGHDAPDLRRCGGASVQAHCHWWPRKRIHSLSGTAGGESYPPGLSGVIPATRATVRAALTRLARPCTTSST